MAAILKCNSCNIVVNELLAYVVNKLHVMDSQSMSRICLAFFSADDIKKAKDLLFVSVPARIRKVIRRNDGKQQRDIDDILDLVHSTEPEQIPMFVARELHKLPPIDFDSVDVTSLLKDIVVLKNELQVIKSSYVTVEQHENLEKRFEEYRRIPTVNNPFHRSVNQSISNVNVRRGAYLDSGPMGLTSTDSFFRINDESADVCEKTVLSHSSPREDRKALSHSSSGQHADAHTSTSAPPPPRSPSPPLPPPRSPVIPIQRSPSEHVQCNDSQVDVRANDARTKEPLSSGSVPRVNCDLSQLPSETEASDRLTFAAMARNGEWKKVEKKRSKSSSNQRLNGKKGKAQINCNFKAADPKVPILITNVHKDTSETDITDYIRRMTNNTVTIKQIVIKDKKKNHKAFILSVNESDVGMFLDESLWPKGIIFRRFINRYKQVNNDNASCTASATVATTDATSATGATTYANK